MVPVISVIISTFDRFPLLDKTLASLKNQTFDKKKFEILVIDAGLMNGTSVVISKYTDALPVRAVPAPQTGLSESRNIGIQQAAGTIVAFLDDDAEADPDWLAEISRSFFPPREKNVCACGGKSNLVWDTEPPGWMNDSMHIILSGVDYGDSPFLMTAPHQFPFGVNMAFRKETFDKTGRFAQNLGRSKGTLLSNEEADMFRRMRQKDLGIYYNPRMVVWHHVPAERCTKDFFYSRYYWQGRSDAMMDAARGFSPDAIIRGVLRVMKRIGILVRAHLPPQSDSSEKNQVARRCDLMYHLGYLRQMMSIRKE